MQTGTIWTILGILVIAAGSFIVYYGSTLNQQVSEKKIIDQQKNSEEKIRGDIASLKKDIAKIQETQGQDLTSQFPSGYQLFGIIDKQIIPSAKSSSEKIIISWSTAKIMDITRDFIKIMLPDAVLPGHTILTGNVVGIKNEVGATSSGGIAVYGYSSFVKILKSDKNEVIAVVGYKKT